MVVVLLLLLLLLMVLVLVMSALCSAGSSGAACPSAQRIGVADGPRPRSRNGDRLLLLLLPTLLPEGGADVLVVADEGVHRISRAPSRLLLALSALECHRNFNRRHLEMSGYFEIFATFSGGSQCCSVVFMHGDVY